MRIELRKNYNTLTLTIAMLSNGFSNTSLDKAQEKLEAFVRTILFRLKYYQAMMEWIFKKARIKKFVYIKKDTEFHLLRAQG